MGRPRLRSFISMRALGATCACVVVAAAAPLGAESAAANPAPGHPSAASVHAQAAQLATLQTLQAKTAKQLAQSEARTLSWGTQLDTIQTSQAALQTQLQQMVISVYENPTGGSFGQMLSAGGLRELAATASLLEAENTSLDQLRSEIAGTGAQTERAVAGRDAQEQQSFALTVQNNAYLAQVGVIQDAQRARKQALTAAALKAQQEREAAAQAAVIAAADASFSSSSSSGGAYASSFAKQDVTSNLVDQSQFPIAAPLTAAGSAAAAAAVQNALAQMGTPYVWGGAQPGAFDCSGLVQWSYGQSGIAIQRTTWAMWGSLPHVASPAQLLPGDVVFFENLGHEGMYLGDGLVVEAPHTGDVVHVRPLAQLADEMGYDGAVRPGDLAGANAPNVTLSVASPGTATT